MRPDELRVLSHVFVRVWTIGCSWRWVVRNMKGEEIDGDDGCMFKEECVQTANAAAEVADECMGDVDRYWEAVARGAALAGRTSNLKLRRRIT